MIAALLIASAAAASSPCAPITLSRPADPAEAQIPHAFQNGTRVPLDLWWVDTQGKRVALGTIAPGGFKPIQTFVGHSFVLTDPAGRCRAAIRIDPVMSGSYVGTSRYRPVAVLPGWHVFVDQALDPAAEPARTALATLARALEDAAAALPPAALARVRTTPIFLHADSGVGGMFHHSPDWLVEHGRTVELLNAVELSNATSFIADVKTQPSLVLHELAHSYYMRLSAEDRAEIDAAYRDAMATGRYQRVTRADNWVGPAYATTNAMEYFAELSEAYFGRNDFFPYTRAELAGHDPVGERMMARIWR